MAGISQIRQVGRISRMLPETERGLLPSPGNSVKSENRVWHRLYVANAFHLACSSVSHESPYRCVRRSAGFEVMIADDIVSLMGLPLLVWI